jgi:hypothetical protein
MKKNDRQNTKGNQATVKQRQVKRWLCEIVAISGFGELVIMFVAGGRCRTLETSPAKRLKPR